MGDELIVAALSLFYADLLKITGPKMMHTQKPNMGDPDDPFDENYLRETSVSDGDFSLWEGLMLISFSKGSDDGNLYCYICIFFVCFGFVG